MKKLLVVFLSMSFHIFAFARWDDSSNSANPSSTVSSTKSFGAASRPRRMEGDYSRTGYSPYSTAMQFRIERMRDPDAQPNSADSVSSVEESIARARLSVGTNP